MIQVQGVTKDYEIAATAFPALRGVDLDVSRGEFVAVIGKSGSGKSTLLNLMGGIDDPSSGSVTVAGTRLRDLPRKRIDAWRGRTVGIVFQFFQLLPTLTAAENVMLPMDFCLTFPPRHRRVRALDLLQSVGVADQADKLPSALALNIRASIIRTLDHLFGSMQYDVHVWLEEPAPFEKAERAIHDTPGLIHAEGWLSSAATISATDGASAQQAGERKTFSVIALPPETDLLTPELVEGRGLRRDDTNAVVVNTLLAQRNPQLRVGSELTLSMGHSATAWRVVGMARVPFAPAGAYVSKHYLEQLRGQPGLTNDLRLVMGTKDRASLANAMAVLENALSQGGVRTAGSASPVEHRVALDEHMRMIYVFLLIVSGMLAAVGGLGLMTTMSLNVLERRREMGVMRTVGASPAAVCSIVVLEGGVIGVLGWAVGSLAPWPISMALGNGVMVLMARTDLDFVFAPAGVIVWFAVCVGLAAAASFVPAWTASRRPIREAIDYE